MPILRRIVVASLAVGILASQQASPVVVSPESLPDRKVAFRIHAPKAESVRLNRGDIPAAANGLEMVKGADGLWAATVGPLPAGAYRYTFNVDGLTVVDPRNPAISESNNNVWSLAIVPGADFVDVRNVPHGAVAAVNYYSTELNRLRRMHVYTPPGYEAGKDKYPVFYLLHGSSDSDASWSTVGMAGYILDNLIADKKAKPMIVVMPAGHTSRAARVPGEREQFSKEFLGDIMPYVDKHYRTQSGRANRAMAGLSMGGGQTMAIGVPHMDQFAYLGVFSSGVVGQGGGGPARPAGPSFEETNKTALENPAFKKGLKLFWFATGKEDAGLKRTEATVAMLKKYGFDVVYKESEGGHVWLNWRDYLNEFAAKLFQ
jgi:enterochelin esterase-like enzyme